MSETKYPTLDEALYLHEMLLERYGGKSGILDLGFLESALGRPRSGYYKSLSEQAAALMHSLAKNHAFVDDNKREALALTAVFLLLNGFHLESSADVSEDFVFSVAAGNKNDIAIIAAWIEERLSAVNKSTRAKGK